MSEAKKKPSKPIDPGFAWFRDYYARYTSAELAMAAVRTGQIVSLPCTRKISPKVRSALKDAGIKKFVPGQNFVITGVVWDQITAVAKTDPELTITFNARFLVAPRNIIFALDHLLEKEKGFLREVMQSAS